MIKTKPAAYRSSMFLFYHRLNPFPLKECYQVAGRYLKKVMSIPRLAKASYKAHTEKITPEEYGFIHIASCHCKMIYSIEFHDDYLLLTDLNTIHAGLYRLL